MSFLKKEKYIKRRNCNNLKDKKLKTILKEMSFYKKYEC